ncbi:MAPEG family protein [Chenggangzhangella methanolivorans]|uniref:MAPEG family protein n=1 Tax=Chenggangzhangella methanolivorans TaxID=1437009 RepID=A0A9E6UP29_9HYPH|nr:MAPEG family protein [Chenggangzhangella methanolivorans]QZO00949.1 MAPEG family protein [Chenggangzhangella methanolivorans]
MIFPATTAVFAALLALVYAGLSFWVVAGRFSSDVLHGDGGNQTLLKRIRSHGNFIEYVPLTLILIGLLEASGAGGGLVTTLLVVLLVARILHPIGMIAPKNSPQQFACRGGGIIATILVMTIAAVTLLARTV